LGNYYSDYAGYDLNGDGVGDRPHRLQDAFEFLIGSRPRLRWFLNSAAADALALAERAFPLVPTSEEEDSVPRMKPTSQVRLTHRSGDTPQMSVLFSLSSLGTLCLGTWFVRRLRG
jgi:nitrous oxidase accessory protein